jgi:DNA-binding LacI/PurR family transcriptional regulator
MAKQRITLKEVANSIGVSYQTVSKVINHQAQVSKDTEERIWQVVRELGYRPNFTARSLRSQRSYSLGYTWAPSPPDQSNPILDQFLHSMFQAAEKQGYYLLCFPFHKDPSQQLAAYRELIDTGRVDGFVLSGVEYNDPRVLFLQERDFLVAPDGQRLIFHGSTSTVARSYGSESPANQDQAHRLAGPEPSGW